MEEWTAGRKLPRTGRRKVGSQPGMLGLFHRRSGFKEFGDKECVTSVYVCVRILWQRSERNLLQFVGGGIWTKMEAITHCQLRHLALCCSSSTSATSSFSPTTSRWRPHSKDAHSTSRRSCCLKSSRVTRMALEQKSPSPAVKCLSAHLFPSNCHKKLLPILLAVGTPKPSHSRSKLCWVGVGALVEY